MEAIFQKRRTSKIPNHLRDKLDRLLDEIIHAGIIRELYENDEMTSWFLKPVIILPKKEYVKLILEARYLNSITVTSNCFWPFELLHVLMTRMDHTLLAVIYHRVQWTKEARKLTSFIVKVPQYDFQIGFQGINNFSKKLQQPNDLCIGASYFLMVSFAESKQRQNVRYNWRIRLSSNLSKYKSRSS